MLTSFGNSFFKFQIFKNISSGDGLVYPLQSQHLATAYESMSDSPSSRIDINYTDKNTVETNSKASETVLIDVTPHTTESSRTNNVLSS